MQDLVHAVQEQAFGVSVARLSCVFAGRRRCDHRYEALAISHTGVNAREVIHRSSEFSPTVDEGVDNSKEGSGQNRPPALGKGYFHWVETTNPAAMKPKPTTMFQFFRDSTGMSPLVT
ncbi:hypothetical protein GCM10010507_07720 [Streptomyces cinnamoneus]|uniref:Uncharacterized protein n=1 Tax=Streptomyces cinnamoneus TaxID=53446 RepID=A0A918T9V2_STRCJ|nr:hypothetical protein GCM10010507_07720 [Streptomyces cinnamoneus]